MGVLTAAAKVYSVWGMIRQALSWIALVSCCGCGWISPPPAPISGTYVQAKTEGAQAELRRAASDRAPATRAAAMEAIGQVLAAQGGDLLEQGLDDAEPGVRFAAAMAIGDAKHRPALGALAAKIKPQTGERDRRVFCAVLYALFRLGNLSHLGDLADLLKDPEPAVRANAAMVMGKIGNPSAVGPLKSVLVDETNETAQYNMTEALAALGDSRSQALLEGFARGVYLDLRLAAIPAIARFQTLYAKPALRDILAHAHSTRVRVSAAGALASMGEYDPQGYDLCIQSCKNPKVMMEHGAVEDPAASDVELSSLQQLAARSLGWMNKPQAVPTLEDLMHHADPPVRVMAAMSIIRILGHAAE